MLPAIESSLQTKWEKRSDVVHFYLYMKSMELIALNVCVCVWVFVIVSLVSIQNVRRKLIKSLNRSLENVYQISLGCFWSDSMFALISNCHSKAYGSLLCNSSIEIDRVSLLLANFYLVQNVYEQIDIVVWDEKIALHSKCTKKYNTTSDALNYEKSVAIQQKKWAREYIGVYIIQGQPWKMLPFRNEICLLGALLVLKWAIPVTQI